MLRPGTVTVTRGREEVVVVFQRVPALVCDNCGEEYLDEATVETLHGLTRVYVQQGAAVVVRPFPVAA